ncbi:MAG: sigma-54-dependent Fis family transcriptional regulator [Calditrichaeota bacterium]|nr:sigma-54-dependent Fis family transcriptional regulator [Calditrichota bacterium]
MGLKEILVDEGYQVDTAYEAGSGLEKAQKNTYDLLLTDFMLPDFDGMELMKRVKADNPQMAVVMMTAFGSVKHAVEALKKGADNYLTKPIDLDELLIVIKKAIKDKRLEQENISLKEKIKQSYKFDNIIGISGKMQDVFKKTAKVAQTNSTVLIRGESGTGKELIARAIHYGSERKDRELVEINCASIPETLLESELFGHEKGSFTGAIKQKIGKFELADGGTIFLDEIAEMPPNVQSKLLRVLQEQCFTRIGGNDVIKVDARVIAATNADLEALMQDGLFREDLYYRLNVIPIRIPPLRERKEDIAPLIQFFLKKLQKRTHAEDKSIGSDFIKAAEVYYWPGNVRELENAIENALTLSEEKELRSYDLPSYILAEPKQAVVSESIILDHLPLKQQIGMAEKIIIEKALAACNGNKSHAAKQLGFSIRTMRNKITKYNIE